MSPGDVPQPAAIAAELIARLAVEVTLHLHRFGEVVVEGTSFGYEAPWLSRLELLFEYGSEMKLGIHVEPEEVISLIVSEGPATEFLLFDIAGRTVDVATQAEVLAEGVHFVGSAYAPLRLDSWIYWTPVSYPLERPRFLM